MNEEKDLNDEYLKLRNATQSHIIFDYPLADDFPELEEWMNGVKFLAERGHFQSLIDYIIAYRKIYPMKDLEEFVINLLDKYHMDNPIFSEKTKFIVFCRYKVFEHRIKERDKKIATLEKEVESLKEQLSYIPGGIGYLDVQKHFIQTARPRRNSF